jgi:hypothetical protein
MGTMAVSWELLLISQSFKCAVKTNEKTQFATTQMLKFSTTHLIQTNKQQANINNNNHQAQTLSTIQFCNHSQQSAVLRL